MFHEFSSKYIYIIKEYRQHFPHQHLRIPIKPFVNPNDFLLALPHSLSDPKLAHQLALVVMPIYNQKLAFMDHQEK